MEDIFKRLRGGSSIYHVRENINDNTKALDILNKISQPTRDSYLAKQELKDLLSDDSGFKFVYGLDKKTLAYETSFVSFLIDVEGGTKPYNYVWKVDGVTQEFDGDTFDIETVDGSNLDFDTYNNVIVEVDVIDAEGRKINSKSIIDFQVPPIITNPLPNTTTLNVGDRFEYTVLYEKFGELDVMVSVDNLTKKEYTNSTTYVIESVTLDNNNDMIVANIFTENGNSIIVNTSTTLVVV